MIIGNFRPGIGNSGKESGFSHIRKAYQANVSYHLKLQKQLQFSGRLSRLGIFGSLHGAGGIMLVAVAAASPGKENDSPVVTGHIGNDFSAFGFFDNSAFRNLNYDVFAILAAAVAFAAFLPVYRLLFADMPEIGQGVQAFVHLENNISAPSAVSAVRAAVRYILFSAERNVTVPAFAASDINSRSVCKHN